MSLFSNSKVWANLKETFWDNRFWDELIRQKPVIIGMMIMVGGFYLGKILPVIQDKNDPTGIFNLPLAMNYLFIGAGVMYMICNAGKRSNWD